MANEIVMTEAKDAEALAQELIAQYHPHLESARILYIFTTQKRRKCDRVRLGSASKMTALQRFLSSGNRSVDEGFDFFVMLDINEWDDLSAPQRVALVDHELLHCGIREIEKADGTVEERWALKAHDLECFADEIRRHGLWKQDVQQVAKVIQQKLPLESPDPSPVRVMR